MVSLQNSDADLPGGSICHGNDFSRESSALRSGSDRATNEKDVRIASARVKPDRIATDHSD